MKDINKTVIKTEKKERKKLIKDSIIILTIMFIFSSSILSTFGLKAANYGSANKVCTINGDNMVIELQGGVLRYITGDWAYHTPPSDRNYSKGDLYVSNLNSMNVVKKWHFPKNTGNFGARINSPLKFDLTGRYGTYGPFNVYSLCR